MGWKFICWFLCSLPAMSSTSVAKPPNFLIILADDAGIGDFGCYGNTTLKTPSVDRLSREGARFNQHLATAALCTPSRAAFLTGRYQTRSGMAAATHEMRVNLYLSALNGLPPSEITMGELVKQRDYATGYIGKWHLGLHGSNSRDWAKHPMNQGFDYYYGAPLTNLKDFGDDGLNTVLGAFPKSDLVALATCAAGLLLALALHRLGLGTVWTILLAIIIILPGAYVYFVIHNSRLLNAVLMKEFEVVEQPMDLQNGNMTQKLVNEAVHYMEQRKLESRPFLLMVSWLQVHTVMHCSAAFRGRSAHGEYGDNLEEMDEAIGQLLQALDHLDLASDTFVYFSSDHGGHSQEVDARGNVVGGYNGIYTGSKTQGGWEGGIRVVGVARYPPIIRPGTVIDAATSQMDLYATVAELAGVPIPTDRIIDGRSMVKLLAGETRSSTHEVLVHLCGTHLHAARYSPTNSTDVWKVHYATPKWLPDQEHCGFICNCLPESVRFHDPPLLFNLDNDPSERTPLDAADPRYASVMQHITQGVRNYNDSLLPVQDQFSHTYMIPRPWLQPYCSLPFLACH